ncbi:hypothetical protein Tco_1185239 [Tanacetum coccineum]
MFKVHGLSKVIDNALISNSEVKGVTTIGGKITIQGIHNNNTNIHTKEPSVFHHDKPVTPKEVLVENEPQKTKEQVVQPSIELQTPSIPFPGRLRKEKEEAQQRKFLENLKQLHINLSFIEALAQMPKYAKNLKSLLTNKARLEETCTVTMNERCSAVLLNKLPSKEKDTGSFTIPCDIGHLHINNALADLGAMGTDGVKSEHLYSASANKIDEKKHELKDLPHHLEYAYVHGTGETQGSNCLEDVGHQGNKSIILHTQDLNGG